MGMGQAAGTAAALTDGGMVRRVNIDKIKATLIADGAILESPDSEVSVGNPNY